MEHENKLKDGEEYLVLRSYDNHIFDTWHLATYYDDEECFELGRIVIKNPDQIIPLSIAKNALKLQAENEQLRKALQYSYQQVILLAGNLHTLLESKKVMTNDKTPNGLANA